MKRAVRNFFRAVRIAAIRNLFAFNPEPDPSLIIGEHVLVPVEMGRV